MNLIARAEYLYNEITQPLLLKLLMQTSFPLLFSTPMTLVTVGTAHIGPKIEKVYNFAKFDGQFFKFVDFWKSLKNQLRSAK